MLPYPQNIPQPRFQLWQQVKIDDRPAIIVGSYYLAMASALKMQADCFGWMYVLDYIFALPPERLLTYQKDATEIVNEADLLETMEADHASS